MDIPLFNTFFTRYRPRFVRFACAYIRDEAMAEDIVVDSMIYYWENRGRLPADTNIPAYILTSVKHKCIDYLRHRQLTQSVSDHLTQLHAWELSTRIATLEEFEPNDIFSTEIQEIVRRTLSTLSPQTRRIFEMSRYDNLSHKEIAERMGVTTKAIEFHITKATKVLRPALKDYLPTTLLMLFLS
ncbi:MAG: RNA polymerase sigma-70 factor [Prevotellaceae bacterium]|jgi:RNA polymerase sigma-70 factor (ECF subfamily)|nr:RNA polymerase sigma-70 factor [Prevotellaceae bacterium]